MNTKTATKQTEIGVIPEDWEVMQLKNAVFKIIDNRGKTPPYSKDSGIELIESASISFVNQHPDYSKVNKFVSQATYDFWFRGHPVKQDILISTVGEYSGSTAIINENRGTIAQNLIAIRINELNPNYVFYWTKSNSFKKQLDQVMMNQAQPSLRVPWLLNFHLIFPSNKQEQTAIAAALSDVDALMSELDKLIAKKQGIKQATMQQLLTGKKRLAGFSGEWEVKRLGEVATLINGRAYKLNCLIPCLGGTNLF
jgi:type I restriction enzyme S subunit